jgi:hypothetical protein
MRSPNRKFWRKAVRGLLSLSVLAGLCALLFPLPIARLPQAMTEKDSSEPFPCQDHPCGCQSAEQCWKKCCCLTDAQKVAWAKANHVTVPDFVMAAARSDRDRCSDSETGKDLVAASCCQLQGTQAAAKKQSGCCSRSLKKSSVVDRKSGTSKWVMAVYAASCQGESGSPVFYPVSIVPGRVALVTSAAEEIETWQPVSERLQKASLRPPLPPPKIV